MIVGLDADFLGTWLSPVEFARQYAKGRTQDDKRSFHVQVEAEMSVTGSNADLRIAVAPSEIGPFALALLGAVARQSGDAGLRAEARSGLLAATRRCMGRRSTALRPACWRTGANRWW